MREIKITSSDSIVLYFASEGEAFVGRQSCPSHHTDELSQNFDLYVHLLRTDIASLFFSTPRPLFSHSFSAYFP